LSARVDRADPARSPAATELFNLRMESVGNISTLWHLPGGLQSPDVICQTRTPLLLKPDAGWIGRHSWPGPAMTFPDRFHQIFTMQVKYAGPCRTRLAVLRGQKADSTKRHRRRDAGLLTESARISDGPRVLTAVISP